MPKGHPALPGRSRPFIPGCGRAPSMVAAIRRLGPSGETSERWPETARLRKRSTMASAPTAGSRSLIDGLRETLSRSTSQRPRCWLRLCSRVRNRF